jgi:outer membrane protein assembly factor BamA
MFFRVSADLKKAEGKKMTTDRRRRPWGTILFALLFLILRWTAPAFSEEDKRSMSAFPILMYDTDIGVGYGGKIKFVNYLARRESFDLILFNSSKGERWYVFTFSVPDFEIRQGKKYGLSFDLRAEYDKYLKNYFYGIGPGSKLGDETLYTSEKTDFLLTWGRGFTPHFVVEAGYDLRKIVYSHIREGVLAEELRQVGGQFSPFASLTLRFDTSDSQINPRRGVRLLLQNDIAGKFLGNKHASFYRLSADFRKYLLLLGSRDVLAFRFLIQKISGGRIPLYDESVLGGGSTMTAMRGYKMNRFMDKGKFLFNLEYRFPVWKKLGGNLFLDAGNVWPSLARVDFGQSVFDAGWGLRYYLENFVARFDVGFSREGTGIYFNFGHVF